MTDDKTRAEFEEHFKSTYPEFYSVIRDDGDYEEDSVQTAWIGWQAAKERYGQPAPAKGWVQYQFWIDSAGNKHNGLHPSLIGMIATKEQKHEQ